MTTSNQTTNSTHAIVVGGSVVGCVIAAILSERFEQVTILERDQLPSTPSPRAGVPQSRHVHVLLARGAQELERLFPGFLREMVEDGARVLDVGHDVAWLTPGGWGARFASGFELCCASRDLIEAQVRRRTLELPNVTLRDGISVDGLVTVHSRSRVVGVQARDRRRSGADGRRHVIGDLVVDATGRGSQLPQWLIGMERGPVREQVIDAGMTYASRFFALEDTALDGWRAAYVQAALPGAPQGGILFPVEGNRWHLTLFGYGEAAPRTDEAGFNAFMEELRSPILSDILQHATPLTPIISHRRTANRWRRFDEMENWPEGLIAAGDSVCCFDPVYGQGMTTGILGAMELKARIDEEWSGSGTFQRGFALYVQKQMARVIRPAWDLATSEDLRLATTTGAQLRRRDRLMQKYFDTVVSTATMDTAVRRRLLSVMNMLTGPEMLLHPRVLIGLLGYLCGWHDRPKPLWRERPASARNERSRPPSGGYLRPSSHTSTTRP